MKEGSTCIYNLLTHSTNKLGNLINNIFDRLNNNNVNLEFYFQNHNENYDINKHYFRYI